MTSWKLFLDDVRNPLEDMTAEDGWRVARTIDEAKQEVIALGLPDEMSLDHDLGINADTSQCETVMEFLWWLANDYGNGQTVPKWRIHSANPIGSRNIEAFMRSWEKSLNLP